MSFVFSWPFFFAWGLVSLLGLRGVIWLASRRRLDFGSVCILTYALAPVVLIGAGFLLSPVAEFTMYGFDRTNWRHQVGYWNFFFAPWGLPLIFGMPPLFVVDLTTWVVRLVRRHPA